MKLSRDEELFLRRWIYDEARYENGPGPAKLLQVQHRVVPADLAVIVAAAIPDLAEQQAIVCGPPPDEPLTWPWSEDALRARVDEARSVLAAAREPGRQALNRS